MNRLWELDQTRRPVDSERHSSDASNDAPLAQIVTPDPVKLFDSEELKALAVRNIREVTSALNQEIATEKHDPTTQGLFRDFAIPGLEQTIELIESLPPGQPSTVVKVTLVERVRSLNVFLTALVLIGTITTLLVNAIAKYWDPVVVIVNALGG